MNEIVSKLLLAGDEFMPEMHSRKPGITYSAYTPFTKNKKGTEKRKATVDSIDIYQNLPEKACV